MSINEDIESLNLYKAQLEQVESALLTIQDDNEKDNLLSLKSDLEQLIELTESSLTSTSNPSTSSCGISNQLNDEYDLFMSEISKCEAIKVEDDTNKFKHLEGKKFRAPHLHKWGDLVYHNALLSSILPLENGNKSDLMAKILFTHPTHEEMRPCPYFLNEDCKFSEDKCRYSHGEVLLFSQLEEYVEPDFENLTEGSLVLAKNKDHLWQRAVIKKIYNEKCFIRFDSNKNECEKEFCDIYPIDVQDGSDKEENSDEGEILDEDLINRSLLLTPTDKLGAWEQYTKGIGTKLLQKMGYIVGTGLGKRSDGRIEPVPAFICPAGKSLDYCLNLKEESNGNCNLITVERKLEQNQKKVIRRSENAYKKSKKKVDVFTYLNDNILRKPNKNQSDILKGRDRNEIKKESNDNLNIESLKLDKHISIVNRDLQSLFCRMEMAKNKDKLLFEGLKKQLLVKESELTVLKDRAKHIKDEKVKRSDIKKLTIF